MRDVGGHAQLAQHQRRGEERQRVDEDRDRRGQRLDQHAGDARADERGPGLAERDLRVGLDEAPAPGHLREQHLVGRAADDVLDAAEEADREQHLDREPVGERGERDHRERERAAHVGDDHDRQLADAVDQHARLQREERERERLERDEYAHLQRRRVQQDRGGQRQREVRDLRAERRDRQRQPHAPEVGGQPQAGERAAQLALQAVDHRRASVSFDTRASADGGSPPHRGWRHGTRCRRGRRDGEEVPTRKPRRDPAGSPSGKARSVRARPGCGRRPRRASRRPTRAPAPRSTSRSWSGASDVGSRAAPGTAASDQVYARGRAQGNGGATNRPRRVATVQRRSRRPAISRFAAPRRRGRGTSTGAPS